MGGGGTEDERGWRCGETQRDEGCKMPWTHEGTRRREEKGKG
jgi:hypothetical protein